MNKYFSLLTKLSLCALLLCCSIAVKSQSTSTTRPYSRYRVHAGIVYVSGQLGISPSKGKLADSTFEAEVTTALNNIKDILGEASSDMSSVIDVTVYLKDMNDYTTFNQIYIKYFTPPYPARSCVAVRDLALGAHIEIAVISVQHK